MSASRQLTIVNKLGLHARAAARLVAVASQFTADIHLSRDARRVNGKSIMGLLMLAAGQGTTLTVTANGPDAEEALERIEALFAERFGEEA